MSGPPPRTGPDTLDVVLFTAAGWRVGVEARHVRGLGHLAGVAGRPIESILGLPVPDVASEAVPEAPYGLRLRGDDRDYRVAGPVEFVGLPVTAIHPLPGLVAASTRLRGLRALAEWDVPGQAGLILLFDVARCGDPA